MGALDLLARCLEELCRLLATRRSAYISCGLHSTCLSLPFNRCFVVLGNVTEWLWC